MQLTLPRVVKVKQHFQGPTISNIDQKIAEEFMKTEIEAKVREGMNIAITAGSRGIANIAKIIQATANEIKKRGANPFIIPAMGSHGGATAEGQIEVLESFGITEEYCGAEIRSSMEVVEVGKTEAGMPVYIDKIGYESDGVILVNRIKAHTDFSSKIESGLMKISSIGLGNHKQAQAIHTYGVHGIRDHMPKVAEVVFQTGKVLMGIGIIENAFEDTAEIEAIPVESIQERESKLLSYSKTLLPKLPIDKVDILFVDKIGKNYSGTGMDTNVIGRIRILGTKEFTKPEIDYIIAGDLSEESHGNALGIGLADVTTEKLFKKVDYKKMNENVITSTFLQRASIPIVLESDQAAIETALRASWGKSPEMIRFMRIPNTLHLEELYVSESLVPEIEKSDNLEIVGELAPMKFDETGYFNHF
ncbi:lactate racemase domain-containing protein [Halalkalibacter kiskunsagensis]|uniref:Lactate racemase domain-containing protein n=1 Tax=Halalkalibacter kiskunsagensis TaxID=1548599 RepID=A0ABV6KD43_9BACI